MSVDDVFDGDENRPTQKVTDEEGSVDEAVKRRILSARERVDKAEQALYVDAPVEREIAPYHQLKGYSTIVRQYIRAIKPLLTSDKIPRADFYYNHVPLVQEEVPPPDGSKDWSRFYYTDSHQRVKRKLGLSAHFDAPEAKTIDIRGLERVLGDDMATLRWDVELLSGKDAVGETETLTHEWVFEKCVFDAAVEHADAFLQQAGIGLEIGHRETDEPEEGAF